MTLIDLLKKKEKIRDQGAAPTPPKGPTLSPDVPEFTFFRTTTTTQEAIEPPSFPGDPTRENALLSPGPRGTFGRFRSRSSASSQGSERPRLGFGRSRSNSSVNVPDNLPEVGGDGVARTEDDEASWEKRATILVTGGRQHGSSQPSTPTIEVTNSISQERPTTARTRSATVGAPADEVCIAHERARVGLKYV